MHSNPSRASCAIVVCGVAAMIGCSSPASSPQEATGSTKETITAGTISPPARLPAAGAPTRAASTAAPQLLLPPGARLVPLPEWVDPLPFTIPAFFPPYGGYGGWWGGGGSGGGGPVGGSGGGPVGWGSRTDSPPRGNTTEPSPSAAPNDLAYGAYCPPGYYGMGATCVLTPGFACPIGYDLVGGGCGLTAGFCGVGYFYDGYGCEGNFGGYPYFPYYPTLPAFSYYYEYYGSYYGSYYGYPGTGFGYNSGYLPYYPFLGSLFPYGQFWAFERSLPHNIYNPYNAGYDYFWFSPFLN